MAPAPGPLLMERVALVGFQLKENKLFEMNPLIQ